MNARLSFQFCTTLFRLLAIVPLITLSGCPAADESDETAGGAEVASFVQALELSVDGQKLKIPLEKMDVFLTEDEQYPEIFEIHGQGVVLVGTFPNDVRVDYGENWKVMLNRAIPISPEGGDPREPQSSHLTLPSGERAAVSGGSFTVTRIGKGWDAKTPLSGTITIKYRDASGQEKSAEGTFAVKGTTWG